MSLYHPQFSDALDIPGAPPVQRTIIIASTPRSGSHMLGHSMMATGVLGLPFEYANPYNLAEWQRQLGTRDLNDTLHRIMARRTTPNGIFSIKLHYEHLKPFGGLRQALDFFPDPVVVRIHRSEILRQAISFAEARQTGRWISEMEGNGRKARYDKGLIDDCLHQLALHNAIWALDLSETDVPVMQVEFEALKADTAGHLARIADLADVAVDPASLPPTPPTRAQSSSDTTAATIRRYAPDTTSAPPQRTWLRRLRADLGRRLRDTRQNAG